MKDGKDDAPGHVSRLSIDIVDAVTGGKKKGPLYCWHKLHQPRLKARVAWLRVQTPQAGFLCRMRNTDFLQSPGVLS